MRISSVFPNGMKVLLENDDERIVRYGVGDFQINDNGTVTLFYDSGLTRTEAPNEETLNATLKSGVDSCADNDPAYRQEDIEMVAAEADNVKDYRPGETVHDYQPDTGSASPQ